MNVKPLADRVIVKALEAEEKSAGGIIIPDNAKEKPQKGEVVAVGPGKVADSGQLVKPEVKKGDKVRLLVTSLDVPHGLSIPEYGINERLDPGKTVTVEFTADKTGSFTAFCSVFCGAGHSKMGGQIVVT